jgi:hypothetical protein
MHIISASKSYLEHVKEGTTMETGLLVGSSNDSRLLAFLREERGSQVELEALGDVVLELNLGAEDVGGGPGLGEDEAVLPVDVLGLNITGNDVALVVTSTSNAESRVGRSQGLDFERDTVEWVVLAEQVARRLAEVLWNRRVLDHEYL